MDLNHEVAEKINIAFSDDHAGRVGASYANGFRDALESFALALQGTIPQGLLLDALQCALDAYGNNDYGESDPDEYDYDDGQPSEQQEWYDFDPDC